jgi:hypothetical protein
MKEEGLLPTRETLTEKYVELGSFVGPAINEGETVFEHLEHIYGVLQGDFWSPDGQARELIISKGLSHTSMSVGNIIQMGDEFWMIKSFGFEKLF